jgi:hypothetical protein
MQTIEKKIDIKDISRILDGKFSLLFIEVSWQAARAIQHPMILKKLIKTFAVTAPIIKQNRDDIS